MNRTKDINPKDAIGDKKVPLALCSPIATAHWAHAQFLGVVKYGAWNWRAADIRTSVYAAAMKRHIDAYMAGEEIDPVDRVHHLGSVMACAAILLEARDAGKLNDDRPPTTVNLRKTYDEIEHGMRHLVEQYAAGRAEEPRHWTIKDTQEIKHAAAAAKMEGQDSDRRGKWPESQRADASAERTSQRLDVGGSQYNVSGLPQR